ncbi:saccharopine dehydrogenase family protein [Actinoallomurus rhizosphaericola]|uniref:saccharopine dehydrogenase family protein n=1 Tax=Actinoallomurus rhizosphaericola TaxID=2952536 RepID=UPI002090B9B0|nr:saccharopine dehydrogenase NADP-binding domain-containing protein [Actinoallomurus rhizosphaericola]MCO5992924.1 saccharopine dehydrogenase NADP-binding domain-containing protein [Actinoallomurus rhizosphaericola]
MRIAVYGASGFTGRLSVAEVRRRGMTPVLVGRNEDRLRTAAVESGAADAEVRLAALDAPDALVGAFADCDAVVNCAGPFTSWGGPVLRAAIAAGRPYVDTSGEQRYIRRILDTYDAEAARAGVAVVPGLADDGGPGDLIAHLTAQRLPEVEELVVADLRRPGGASRGTARTMATAFADGPLDHVDGSLVPADGQGPASLGVPGSEEVPVAPFPLPGVATVPRHVRARRVRSVIRADVAALFQSLTPDLVESVPEVLDDETRRAGRWLMTVRAEDGAGGRAEGWVTGPDPYGLTAVIAVEGARRLASGEGRAGTAGRGRVGALTPAQAFDPADFLDFLVPYGVAWQVSPAPGQGTTTR